MSEKHTDHTNEVLAEAMTESVSEFLMEYDGYEGFKGINFKGEVYRRIKDILDNGIDE